MVNSCDPAPLERESISPAGRWELIAGSAIDDSAPLIFLMGMHPAAKKFPRRRSRFSEVALFLY